MFLVKEYFVLRNCLYQKLMFASFIGFGRLSDYHYIYTELCLLFPSGSGAKCRVLGPRVVVFWNPWPAAMSGWESAIADEM